MTVLGNGVIYLKENSFSDYESTLQWNFMKILFTDTMEAAELIGNWWFFGRSWNPISHC